MKEVRKGSKGWKEVEGRRKDVEGGRKELKE
jgi:hypothetical protein